MVSHDGLLGVMNPGSHQGAYQPMQISDSPRTGLRRVSAYTKTDHVRFSKSFLMTTFALK
jgi:hypothetical protein